MTYTRPDESVPKLVDLYCCRNPFCRQRLRTVSKGLTPKKHCGIEPRYVSTLTQQHWNNIVIKNDRTIAALNAVICADKIRKERAA